MQREFSTSMRVNSYKSHLINTIGDRTIQFNSNFKRKLCANCSWSCELNARTGSQLFQPNVPLWVWMCCRCAHSSMRWCRTINAKQLLKHVAFEPIVSSCNCCCRRFFYSPILNHLITFHNWAVKRNAHSVLAIERFNVSWLMKT